MQYHHNSTISDNVAQAVTTVATALAEGGGVVTHWRQHASQQSTFSDNVVRGGDNSPENAAQPVVFDFHSSTIIASSFSGNKPSAAMAGLGHPWAKPREALSVIWLQCDHQQQLYHKSGPRRQLWQ